MSAIKWKQQKVVSIKIKNDLFVLAQMLVEPYFIFFNLFNDSEEWDVDLDNASILFCHAVTRQFLKKTTVNEQKSIIPLENYLPPNRWIHVTGAKRITVKIQGLEEKEIVTLAERRLLIEKDILNQESNVDASGLYKSVVKELDNKTDVGSYELTTIEIYPNLNERLFLCHKLGRNVDPAKEIIFEKSIPREYATFVDILSGQVPLSSLGY